MAFERLKYKLLFKRKFLQSNELSRMFKIQNNSLNIVAQSFIDVKDQNFVKEDLKAFKKVALFRKNLLKNQSIISYRIFGSEETKIVADICKVGASSKKWGQLLYLISKKIETPKVLEIGTNLGISGSYILEAIATKKESKLITMEGVKGLCEIASNNFNTIADKNTFEVLQGLYDKTFPEIIKKNVSFNFLFIDGNHDKKATLEYFEALKKKIMTPSIFIFDDIHWSRGMTEAWALIIKDPSVTFSIDLYKCGIIIIDDNANEKNQHFTLHPLSL